MSEIIYIPCGIENCKQHFDYQSRKEPITALEASWKHDLTDKAPLADIPFVGQQYDIKIWGALKIDIAQSFWAIYFDPLSTLNGLDSEQGIQSTRFCLCQKIALHNTSVKTLQIKVNVLKVLDLGYANQYPSSKPNIAESLLPKTELRYYSVQNFENYALITINFESDLGWQYIIAKENESFVIIAENYWDFHQDTWQFQNEMVTSKQATQLGLKPHH